MTVLAHAFGQRYDLPIPLWLFVLGGALVVIASFLLIVPRGAAAAVAGDTEHVDAQVEEQRAAALDGSWIRGPHPVWGALSVLWLAFLIWCGLTGSEEVAENLVVTWLWLLVWIAVPLSVALIGDWTQPVNPYAFLSKIADAPRLRAAVLGGPDAVRWPDWLGWWPAVVLFFLAAIGELVYNLDTTVPQEAAQILLPYAVFTLLMGFLFGREWLRRGGLLTAVFPTRGGVRYVRLDRPGRRGLPAGVLPGVPP